MNQSVSNILKIITTIPIPVRLSWVHLICNGLHTSHRIGGLCTACWFCGAAKSDKLSHIVKCPVLKEHLRIAFPACSFELSNINALLFNIEFDAKFLQQIMVIADVLYVHYNDLRHGIRSSLRATADARVRSLNDFNFRQIIIDLT